MAKLRAKHGSCSVNGCIKEHKSLYILPTSEPLKTQWTEFIFDGLLPARLPKVLYVCAQHFREICFHNLGAYNAGFAKQLKLKQGSIPTVRDTSVEASTSVTSTPGPASVDAACQTDPLDTRTFGTQLSFRTLQPHFRSVGIQANMSCKDSSSTPVRRPSKKRRLGPEEEQEEDLFEGSSSKGVDSTYDPADSVSASTEPTVFSAESSTHNIKKYIVYESCIMELFAACPICTRACDSRTRKRGTFLSVEQRCPHCQFYRQWNSQPLLGSTPAGDLHLSAAVYLSGASFFKVARVFEAMQLQSHQHDTFRRHARAFIEPAVVHYWRTSQDVMLQRLSQEGKVMVGGDMRGDSPGHSAESGSYIMMDLSTNKVLDIQLLQSNEVAGSHHMEREGLMRSLAVLEASGVSLDCIVTGRRPQVQKFLRENNISHYYDVWHMAKGISKKLEKIRKQKGCEKLQKWMRSINNHIYWTAASSTTGPERVAKWTSILNHVQDIHTHGDPLYPKCLHEIRHTRDKSKWLQAATPAFYKLKKVLTNRRTLKDVARLSPRGQTSSVDAFHRIVLRFAPKNVAFPFIGRLCRLYLAAMYYNENVDRPQARTQEGKPLFKLHFPKATKGQCRAKPCKTEPTFGYVADMMDLIFEEVIVDPAAYTDALLAIPVPEDLRSQCGPDKEDVIASYVSRFNRGPV